jgi:hypothetical protein
MTARRLLPLSLLAAAGLLVATPAASARTVKYEATGSVRAVKQVGSTVTYQGRVSTKRFGAGKVRQRLRLSGLSATGTFRVRYPGGTLRGRVSARAQLAGGHATFSGTLRITGGTGRFAGARGTGTYSGTSSLDLRRANFRQTGTVTF